MAAISTLNGVHFVAGAPRANYTGQIVLYSVNKHGNVTVIQSHRGDQVNIMTKHVKLILWITGAGEVEMCFPSGSLCLSHLSLLMSVFKANGIRFTGIESDLAIAIDFSRSRGITN